MKHFDAYLKGFKTIQRIHMYIERDYIDEILLFV